MNLLTKHIPGFADNGDEPPKWEFETTEQLLSIPFVESWKTAWPEKGFQKFAMSGDCLVACYDGGKFWWVVGHIRNPSEVNLPKHEILK